MTSFLLCPDPQLTEEAPCSSCFLPLTGLRDEPSEILPLLPPPVLERNDDEGDASALKGVGPGAAGARLLLLLLLLLDIILSSFAGGGEEADMVVLHCCKEAETRTGTRAGLGLGSRMHLAHLWDRTDSSSV